MESIRRILAVAVIAGMVSLGISGCGNDESEVIQQETEQTTPAEPAQEQPVQQGQSEEEVQGEPETQTQQESLQPEEERQAQEQTDEDVMADTGPTRVRLTTTKGDIVVELYDDAAPITVANFMRYVLDDAYDGTIFHRVIPNFVIQGGGFTPGMERVSMNAPIKNESSNSLANKRGTIAMARTQDPDSATNQFFINLSDNKQLNYGGPGQPGYAVFGRVVEGMNVVDAIAKVPTKDMGQFQDVPVEPVVIEKAEITGASVVRQQQETTATEPQQMPQN